jgi:hypothetical protein
MPLPGFLLGFIMVAVAFNGGERLIINLQQSHDSTANLLTGFEHVREMAGDLSQLFICSAMWGLAISFNLGKWTVPPIRSWHLPC